MSADELKKPVKYHKSYTTGLTYKGTLVQRRST